MKVLSTLLFVALASIASAAPQVTVDEAVKIASKYLKESGNSDTWITSVALEQTSLSAGKPVWSIRWNTPIIVSETKRETGLEVAMDGSFARYTEKMANTNTPSVAGVPASRAELSNHRTRSQRPSILDLKH
jgi:hypothetical protein